MDLSKSPLFLRVLYTTTYATEVKLPRADKPTNNDSVNTFIRVENYYFTFYFHVIFNFSKKNSYALAADTKEPRAYSLVEDLQSNILSMENRAVCSVFRIV